MKEEHHIIPRCMGGSDDPHNKIMLSPAAHAIISVLQSEHYQRPCVHPRQLKYLPKELYASGKHWVSKASKLGGSSLAQRLKDDPEFRDEHSSRARTNIRASWRKGVYDHLDLLGNLGKAKEAALSPKAKAKRLETLKRIGHAQGPKNSQYGTMWITDGTANRKIKRGEPLPEGFRPGRVM